MDNFFSWLGGAIGDWFTQFFSGFDLNGLETHAMPSERPIGEVGTQDVGGIDPFTGSLAADPFTTVADSIGTTVADSTGGGTADPFTNQSSGNGELADAYGSAADTPFGGGADNPTAHPMVAAEVPADGGGSSAVSAATAVDPTISDVASDTGGSVRIGTVYYSGVAYNEYVDISGAVYEIPVNSNQQTSLPTPSQSVVSPSAPPTMPPLPPSLPPLPPPDPPTTPDSPPAAAAPATAATTPPPAPQPTGQGGSPTASQRQEENWGAAKGGMWDSLVDMAQGFDLRLLGISFDWAKFGPPAPTGNPARDAELLDNYRSGGWVTTTFSLAAPFAAEGVLSSALSAATNFPLWRASG